MLPPNVAKHELDSEHDLQQRTVGTLGSKIGDAVVRVCAIVRMKIGNVNFEYNIGMLCSRVLENVELSCQSGWERQNAYIVSQNGLMEFPML